MNADALRMSSGHFQPVSRRMFLFQLHLHPMRCWQLQWSLWQIIVHPLPSRDKQSFGRKHIYRCVHSVFASHLQCFRPIVLQRLSPRLLLL
jgi:hypothetical protein